MTSSAGTKMNSASVSMNRLISHGHAIRSILGRARVIHLIGTSWYGCFVTLRTLENVRQFASFGSRAVWQSRRLAVRVVWQFAQSGFCDVWQFALLVGQPPFLHQLLHVLDRLPDEFLQRGKVNVVK